MIFFNKLIPFVRIWNFIVNFDKIIKFYIFYELGLGYEIFVFAMYYWLQEKTVPKKKKEKKNS